MIFAALCAAISTMNPLEIKDLRKSYKVGFWGRKQEVLKGVSFKIREGKITGFLGANGAGKTTTIRCLLELAYKDSGQIHFFGQEGFNLKTKKRIGFLPERPYFYEHLTGVEFLTFYNRLSGNLSSKSTAEKINRLLKRVDLLHAKDKALGEYSKGMLQKIGIAQALIHDPELLILDEPMSGLDPDGRYYLSEIIKECAQEGRTVFFSSHLLPDAEKLCEDLVILKNGKVYYEGLAEGFISKMGDASLITYSLGEEKISKKVNSKQELQTELDALLKQKANIIEVKRDQNLEDAFVALGLRGDE